MILLVPKVVKKRVLNCNVPQFQQSNQIIPTTCWFLLCYFGLINLTLVFYFILTFLVSSCLKHSLRTQPTRANSPNLEHLFNYTFSLNAFPLFKRENKSIGSFSPAFDKRIQKIYNRRSIMIPLEKQNFITKTNNPLLSGSEVNSSKLTRDPCWNIILFNLFYITLPL